MDSKIKKYIKNKLIQENHNFFIKNASEHDLKRNMQTYNLNIIKKNLLNKDLGIECVFKNNFFKLSENDMKKLFQFSYNFKYISLLKSTFMIKEALIMMDYENVYEYISKNFGEI